MAVGSPAPDDLIVRRLEPSDIEFIWQVLYWAAHVDEDDGVSPEEMRRDPDLVGHVAGWGRDGDLGVIAELDDRPVGAAWLRLFVAGVSDFSVFVDDDTPELVAAVDPAHAGTGIGSLLLTRLFDDADDVYVATVLSVRADNPAVRLYERVGYREVDRHTNRVGTESLRMIRTVPRASERPR